VGVFVSTAVVAAMVHLMLGWSWHLGLLCGAVLSSTDAAAVFSTLRRLRLRPRLTAVLEAESGINDASAVILVLVLSATGGGATSPWWQEFLLVPYELGIGGLVGAATGLLGAFVLRRVALPAAGLYPLAAMGLAVLAYAGGTLAHASGFLAVYVAGVILGNAGIPHRRAVLGFADGLAWLAQIGLFVLLGMLSSPRELIGAVVPGLVVGVVLVVVARPVSVLLSTTWFGMRWREQLVLSAAGLRGAVPIVLATLPLSLHTAGAETLFNVVFVLVVIFTFAQASTIAPLARRLGMTVASEATELTVESAPLETMRADLLQLEVPTGSHLTGVHIDELRLPTGAVVTMVLRDGVGFVPTSGTRLRTGDSVLIVATAAVRDLAEHRLRAVSRRGRLARWLGEDGRNAAEQ
jgi:cell volume regulation protein A